MAASGDEAEVLNKIQETYVPFLKKLIAFLEKTKKATPDNLAKLKAIYTVFTTASSREQVETYNANKKKLQDWYIKAQKDKGSDDGDKTKRSFASSDTENSQGGLESMQPPCKKNNFTNSDSSDSSQPAVLIIQSVNQHSAPTNNPVNISQIKKEKIETSKIVQSVKDIVSQPSKPATPPAPAPVSAAPSDDDPITFTCASCQFQTQEESEFMKHARTDHRTDLSMWCKQCGKCFSNAGVLVAHIKERACIKEEMIYKCGVKDCIFETTSGQTFVHHLRHCHKGSPFIFCVHCQKIFTLPHCLILHMQDDCPFKDRNRRNPSAGGVASAPPPPSNPKIVSAGKVPIQPKTMSIQMPTLRPQTPQNVSLLRPIAPRASPSISTGIVRTPASLLPSSAMRGRGRSSRGRGRGRGRVRISDSSDSDDPDDPSWHPEELLGETGLRRSGRWAKKINDVMNPEPSTSGVTVSSSKKSFTSAELNAKMINCPCCDFMAAFQSVLEDHYIANHKVPNKNACLVCHLKFENTRAFLDHFEEHRKGNLPCVEGEVTIEATSHSSKKQIEPQNIDIIETDSNSVPIPSKENELFDGVLTSIDGTKVTDPITKDKSMEIPYQAMIHEKSMKESKFKKFEELKSPNDLITMKTIQKLQHFFKCGLYSCTYTTDSVMEFSDHLKSRHDGKRFHCCYCLKDELNSEAIANHIAVKHNKRIYQCSKCFYRAYSKAHVQIHISNSHTQDPYTDILVCNAIEVPDSADEEPSPAACNTTWPYICAVGQCDYSTYDPKEFKKHNETAHRSVSVFLCHYCKVDFITFKRLMNHYRLHGLNVFQCNYCIHGAETKEEILLHLCNAHSDEPLRAYMRGSKEEATSEEKQLNSGVQEESSGRSFTGISSSNKGVEVENSETSKENLLNRCEIDLYQVIDNKCYPKHMQFMSYPKYVKNLFSDIICGIPFCNEKFQNIEMYFSHLRSDHDALNLPCPYCPEMCDSWSQFKNHLLCHGSKLYACNHPDCEFCDSDRDKVKEHKMQHEDSDDSVAAVREFSAAVDEIKLSTLHVDVDFPVVERSLTCLFCKYKCANKNMMKNHLYKELAYQRFDCSLCEKKCLSRKKTKEHFIKAHPGSDILCSTDNNIEIEAMVKTLLTEPQKFENAKLTESCDMCCKKIKNSLKLQSHLHVCLQKEYRPYECHPCNKHFVSLLALKYHTDEMHDPKPMEYSVVSNSAIEEDIEKNLLKIRLKQLNDIFEESNIEVQTDEKSYKVKFYTCSDCAYESHHKFNVQMHNKKQHDDKANVMKGRECNLKDNSGSQLDENSNDSTSGKSLVKRYSCTYCIRKMQTIQEVEKHMRKAHTNKNTEYFYYFTPDPDVELLPEDKEIYQCAYCKHIVQENLFALKKHADLMHQDMEFKLKGLVSCRQPQNNYLACGYCYAKVDNHALLQEHSASSHPLLALKLIGDFQTSKSNSKRTHESSDDFPNKRVKFNSAVYVCSHCGGAFSSMEAVSAHSKRAHSRIALDYKKMDQLSSSVESTDSKFYKCEFCKFTSERHFLDKHLALKHKMRVTCSYCNKRFEFASKLKEHHDVAHKNLPIKYSQETVPSVNTISNDLNVCNSDKNSVTADSSAIPRSGPIPEDIDLDSITVRMKTNEGGSAILPLVYVTECFNMFPKVVLTDIMKKNS